MTLGALLDLCDQISPFELQESWDNSGLIIGDPGAAIGPVVCALEADDAVIKEAPTGAAIVVHHPLIFGSLKQLNFSRYPANLISKMIAKNQSLIALHTNFDKTHLNRHVAREVLKWQNFSCEDYLCIEHQPVAFETVLAQVKAHLNPTPRVVFPAHALHRVALCTGSGAGFADPQRMDLLLTGDIKYHDAMAAKSMGVGLIDIGHYESERFFAPLMAGELKANGIAAIMSDSKNPFVTP
jgi:dinuclear metal center YbgI/SA1388 family protein